LTRVVDLIVQLAAGDLTARLDPSPARDSVDAVITGINLLADELDNTYQTLEQRVIDRTALLDQARRELERHWRSRSADRSGQPVATGRPDRAGLRPRRSGARPPCVFRARPGEFKTITMVLGQRRG